MSDVRLQTGRPVCASLASSSPCPKTDFYLRFF